MNNLKRNLKIHNAAFYFGVFLLLWFGAEAIVLCWACSCGATFDLLWLLYMPILYGAICWFTMRMDYHIGTIRGAICLKQEYETRKKLPFDNIVKRTAGIQPRPLKKLNPKVR